MARPFDPRDVGRVRSLQRTGCVLDYEGAVLTGGSALRHAMEGLLPGPGRRFATWVEPGPPAGFVQARKRRSGRIWDLVCVGPIANGSSILNLHRLLTYACQRSGDDGCEQVHSAVPDDETVMTQTFRQLGFTPVGVSMVMKSYQPSAPAGRSGVQPSGASDAESRVVQAGPDLQAELDVIARAQCHPSLRPTTTWETPLGGWAEPEGGTRVAFSADGTVESAWRWFTGRSGSWLQLLTNVGADARAAVQNALADSVGRAGGRLPVCTAVPAGHALVGALEAAGFESELTVRKLVKHTTARILEPSWEMGALRDAKKLDGAAPTASSER